MGAGITITIELAIIVALAGMARYMRKLAHRWHEIAYKEHDKRLLAELEVERLNGIRSNATRKGNATKAAKRKALVQERAAEMRHETGNVMTLTEDARADAEAIVQHAFRTIAKQDIMP